MRALVLVACLVGVAHAGELREPLLPQRTLGIAATPSGALVIEEESSRLVAIEPAGVREVPHPDVGLVTWLADDAWALGQTGVLHRTDAGWARIDLAPLPGPQDRYRPGYLALIAPDRLVAVRYFGGERAGGTLVELVEGAKVQVIATLDGVIVSRPVGDGRGGFWAIVRKRSIAKAGDSYTGYAHYSDGHWTLWRQVDERTSSYIAELPPMEVRDAIEKKGLLDELVYAGDGGVMARWYTGLYRITADGVLSAGPSVQTDKVCAVVAGRAGHVVVSTANLSHLYVSWVAADGRVTGPTEIELPAWYREAHFRPPVYYCEASLAGDRLWIASGPFVIERDQATGAVVVRVALQAVDETARDNAGRHASVLATAVPPLLVAGGIGTLGGAAIGNDTSYGATAAETVAGTVAGLPAALLLDFLAENECTSGNDSGYQIYNDFACGLRFVGFVVGIAGGGALAGLSAYKMGAQFDELPSKHDAFVGAFGGAMVGAAVSIAATKLVNSLSPRAGRVARSVFGATLIGAGATIGYQLRR